MHNTCQLQNVRVERPNRLSCPTPLFHSTRNQDQEKESNLLRAHSKDGTITHKARTNFALHYRDQ